MKVFNSVLALKLEDDALHPALVRKLAGIANCSESLDEVERLVKLAVNVKWWMVTRGGHHVALVWRPSGNRCAMIYEVEGDAVVKGGLV